MTEAELKHRAGEASRLLQDQTLLWAISEAQNEAKNGLVTVDADNKTEILRLQAHVKAFDEILTVLEQAIIAAPRSE